MTKTKKLYQRVLERSDGICEICRGNHMVQMHHVIGGNGKKRQHESYESVLMLCWDCHHGNDGVHGKNGHKLDKELKQEVQDKYFDQGYEEEEVRKMMGGKLY